MFVLIAMTQAFAQGQQADFEARLALAKKMHELQPAKEQVWSAIDQVSLQQPESEREIFVTKMREILNYKAIEKVSIDAMVETYTAPELEAMVEYYAKPEAISASKKIGVYSQKVYPEILKMLDQAMMKLRTGG
ncbi:MAG: hypothetical protein ACT4OY_09080 [Alphaproteobacteria bacterium]